MSRWLYRYEAKGIQGYVLGSSRLKEIAGASALVESLAEDADEWSRAADPQRTKLMAAAGNAMYRFSNREALADFAAHWPIFCEKSRPGLQVVQAWCELTGEEPTRDELDTLFARLESARNLPQASLPEAGPLAARSGRSGLPAVDTREGALVDAPSMKRLEAFHEDQNDDPTGLVRRMLQELPPGQNRERARVIYDAQEFPEGYLAVIHADGNGIGRFFVGGQIPFAAMGDFSKALGEATTRAARKALDALDAAHGRPRSPDFVPFRPVVLGGDDLTVIALAEDAIPFTHCFLLHFERETARALRPWISNTNPQGFTACAGIAMIRRGFPFHIAYDLAEALCAHAKRHDQGLAAGSRRSSLMFHRVTSAAVTDWDDIVRRERTVRSTGENTWSFIGGPWSIGPEGTRTLSGLADLAGFLGEGVVPRGPVREWLSVAQADRDAGGRHWLRVLEVLGGDREGARIAESLRKTLCALGANGEGWREDGTTPIADAVEWHAITRKTSLWCKDADA